MKVGVTGLYVPGVNAGMFTVAFVALTTVNDESASEDLDGADKTEDFATANIFTN